MSIKITKLKVKNGQNKAFDHGYFYLELEFEVKNGKESWENYDRYFDRLDEYYETLYLKDPKKHKKLLNDLLKKFDNNVMEALNSKRTKSEWEHQRGYVQGYGMIQKTKSKNHTKIVFKEYFTSTPVTQAILSELKKMERNPDHSFKTIPEQYLAHLLESLSNFWD